MVDLSIYTGTSENAVVFAKELVWVGGPGQIPELHLNTAGSLVVRSMNIGFGRDKWQQDLAISWQEDSFVLAGFTYTWHDSLNTDDSGTCDINLLSGWTELKTGNLSAVPRFRTSWLPVPIAEWVPDYPKECGFD